MSLLDKSLKRRDFLKGTAAAAAATAAFGLSGCSTGSAQAAGSDGAHVVASDASILADAGEWMPIHCHQNCNQMCLNMGYVVDGVVVRQKTDDAREDSFDCPQQRGCLRGRSLRQQVYNADRIKYPHEARRQARRRQVRSKSRGTRPVDTIASELKRIIDEYGNESVYIPYATGVSSTTARSLPRFMNCIGGCLGSYGDYSAMQMEMIVPHTYGASGFSGSTLNAAEDAALILAFGTSPTETRQGGAVSHYDWVHLRETTKGKMIYIDPRMNDSVMGRSAEWQPINPGTDAALALGMMNVIIGEDLVDHDFIDKWTYGFEALAERVKDYPVEKVAEICWVEPELIVEAARFYAKAHPSTIQWGPRRGHVEDRHPYGPRHRLLGRHHGQHRQPRRQHPHRPGLRPGVRLQLRHRVPQRGHGGEAPGQLQVQPEEVRLHGVLPVRRHPRGVRDRP